MRCLPHPISGAIYRELGDGLVRVEDKEKGIAGTFTWNGDFVEGDLTQADLHYLGFVGGPTLPPEKDIIWTFLPVGDPEPAFPPAAAEGPRTGRSPA